MDQIMCVIINYSYELEHKLQFFPPDKASCGKQAEYGRPQIQHCDGKDPERGERRCLSKCAGSLGEWV